MMSRRFLVLDFDLSMRLEELRNYERGDIIYCIPTSTIYEVYENDEGQKLLWSLFGGNIFFYDGSIAISVGDIFEVLKRKFQEDKMRIESEKSEAEKFQTFFDKDEKYLHVKNFKEIIGSIVGLIEVLKKKD